MAAASGDCVNARVGEPFRLPDGLLYPAGLLTICDGGAYLPVDNFQRILVAGSARSACSSARSGRRAALGGSPQVVFRRGADSSLNLVGYTVPSTGRSVAYRMKHPDDLLAGAFRARDGRRRRGARRRDRHRGRKPLIASSS